MLSRCRVTMSLSQPVGWKFTSLVPAGRVEVYKNGNNIIMQANKKEYLWVSRWAQAFSTTQPAPGETIQSQLLTLTSLRPIFRRLEGNLFSIHLIFDSSQCFIALDGVRGEQPREELLNWINGWKWRWSAWDEMLGKEKRNNAIGERAGKDFPVKC